MRQQTAGLLKVFVLFKAKTIKLALPLFIMKVMNKGDRGSGGWESHL